MGGLNANQAPTTAAAELPPELVDHAIDLFDLLGVYGAAIDTDDTSSDAAEEIPRLSLVSDIVQFSRVFSELDIAVTGGFVPERSSTEEIDEASRVLLSLEEHLFHVRTSANFFLSSLQEERRDIENACKGLREIAVTTSMQAWASLAEAVALEFRRQSLQEEQMTKSFLQSLDSIYTNNDGNRKKTMTIPFRQRNNQISTDSLNALVLCLQRQDFRNRHVLRHATRILNGDSDSHKYSETLTRQSFPYNSKPLLTVVEEEPRVVPVDMDDNMRLATERGKQQQQQQHEPPPSTILSLVQRFLDSSSMPSMDVSATPKTTTHNNHVAFTSALVVGPTGSGKSFACDEMERMVAAAYGDDVSILRPQVPLDFLGSCGGQAEDAMVALFHAAAAADQTAATILILEDVDALFPTTDVVRNQEASTASIFSSASSNTTSHQKLRLESTFLHILDNMFHFLNHNSPFLVERTTTTTSPSHVLLVCTSKEPLSSLTCRFNHVFFMKHPTQEQRENLIVSSLLGENNNAEEKNNRISQLAEALVGRSYVELSQLCGQALMEADLAGSHGVDDALGALERCIHRKSPESLRSGMLGDFVDMQVYSAKDLLLLDDTTRTAAATPPKSLYGEDVDCAWKKIETSVILPLCRRRELAQLMLGGGETTVSTNDSKTFCGGILLCGPPGTGKTSLAFQAARYACRLLPTLHLIDVSCTSLIHKEVGGSEQAVHRLFASARQAAPCILLLDGIENVAATRGNDSTTEGSLDRVLSTLLVEMDGVDEGNRGGGGCGGGGGIAVIGITHNEKWIDPALKRPGRLSKSVWLGLPHEKARYQIIKSELNVLPVSPGELSVDEVAAKLSLATEGMTGASIVAACNHVLLTAAKGVKIDEKFLAEPSLVRSGMT